MRLHAPPRVAELWKVFVLDEAQSTLRHDLRNRLAAIRNAEFYLKRRITQLAPALAENDRRVPQMLELIETELRSADEMMSSRLEPPAPDPRADPAEVVAG